MAVSEQTDSLRVLGSDPVDYLITPRVAACMIAGPILNLMCFCMGAPPWRPCLPLSVQFRKLLLLLVVLRLAWPLHLPSCRPGMQTQGIHPSERAYLQANNQEVLTTGWYQDLPYYGRSFPGQAHQHARSVSSPCSREDGWLR